jgi:site-specific recombinase XerC
MPRLLSVNRCVTPSGELSVTLGHELLDDYLTFLAGRVRPNSLLAAAFDLKVFFSVVQKEPAEVTSGDVIGFITFQRAPRVSSKVVRISDGGSGLSARTVARRLSSISGLYAYLIVKGEAGVHSSPVPRGLITRRARRNGGRAAPLVRSPRLLPRILEPGEVDTLMAALRTRRDRAMVEAMVFGGLLQRVRVRRVEGNAPREPAVGLRAR